MKVVKRFEQTLHKNWPINLLVTREIQVKAQWYATIHSSEWAKLKDCKDMKKYAFSYIADGNINWYNFLEEFVVIYKKWKIW